MSKFRKRYNETFNNIHAPDSIRQEVICMSKKLNQNDEFDTSNNIIETNEVEISKGFNTNRLVALVTSIAMVGGCFFGYRYFKNSNQEIGVEVSNSETSISFDNTIIVKDVSATDNSNFEDIFGLKLESLEFNYLFGNEPNSIIKYCNSNDDIFEVVNSFNTSSWVEDTEFIFNDDNINTQLNLTLNAQNNDLVMTFFYDAPENDVEWEFESATLYVRVLNESKGIDKCYIVDDSTFNNIYHTIEENNYLYFDVNPKSSLYVEYDIQENETEDHVNFSTTIKNKSTLSDISNVFYNDFNWQLDTEGNMFGSDEFYNSIIEYNRFTFDLNSQAVTFDIYYTTNMIYVKSDDGIDIDSYVFKPSYILTSDNLEKSYKDLINLITLNYYDDASNTISATAITAETSTEKITTTPVTTTEKITTTPVTTTEKITTIPVTITTPVTTIEEINTIPVTDIVETTVAKDTIRDTEVSQIHLPLQTIYNPSSAICYNMKSNEARPQFFDYSLQEFFSDAYYIRQSFSFGVPPLTYDENDYFIQDNRTYYKIRDTKLETLDDVRDYFKQFFTDNYIDTIGMMNNFIEKDGFIYCFKASKDGNPFYIGHTFVLDNQSNDRIEFHANVYYQYTEYGAEMYTGDFFYNEIPTVPYEIQICNYVLVKTENGWCFDILDTML